MSFLKIKDSPLWNATFQILALVSYPSHDRHSSLFLLSVLKWSKASPNVGVWVLYVHVYVGWWGSEPVYTVGRSETSISCPVYHSSLDSFKTGSLAEPGTGLVASKPQPLSCLWSQQLRAYKRTATPRSLYRCSGPNSGPHAAQPASYLLNCLSNPNTQIGFTGSSEAPTWKC